MCHNNLHRLRMNYVYNSQYFRNMNPKFNKSDVFSEGIKNFFGTVRQYPVFSYR